MDTDPVVEKIKNSKKIKYINIEKKNGIQNIPVVIYCSPPSDNRCGVCRKHISELEPYGENGEPLEEDFSGKYFVGRIRPFIYSREDWPMIFYDKESDIEYLYTYFRKKCGKNRFLLSCSFGKQIVDYKSKECRECILLNTDEYIKKIFK